MPKYQLSCELQLNISELIIPLILLTSTSLEINFAILNKIHSVVFLDSNILKLILENQSFQNCIIQSANSCDNNDVIFAFFIVSKVSVVITNEDKHDTVVQNLCH